MTPGLSERHPLKEKRRANKPLLERKRRAKINDSLSDLKKLVLSSMNKDVSRYAKMEKVDILDMTVRYLKGSHQPTTMEQPPLEEHLSFYRAGYAECTQHIQQIIMSMEGVDLAHKYKLRNKLSEELHPGTLLHQGGGGPHLSSPSPTEFSRQQPQPVIFRSRLEPTTTGGPYMDEQSPYMDKQSPYMDTNCVPTLEKSLDKGILDNIYYRPGMLKATSPSFKTEGDMYKSDKINRDKFELYSSRDMNPLLEHDDSNSFTELDPITVDRDKIYCREQSQTLRGRSPVHQRTDSESKSMIRGHIKDLISPHVDKYQKTRQKDSKVWRPW